MLSARSAKRQENRIVSGSDVRDSEDRFVSGTAPSAGTSADLPLRWYIATLAARKKSEQKISPELSLKAKQGNENK